MTGAAPAAELCRSLDAGLEALGAPLPAAARDALAAYTALVERWNRAYNLVGPRELRHFVPRHLLDSLSVLPWLAGDEVLDVGSGAGLPGLVLAIAQPQRRFVLLDSRAKRIRFLDHAVAALGVGNAETVACRVETYRPGRRFPTIVSRATLALPALAGAARPLLAAGGRVLAMKGRHPGAEIAALGAGAAAEVHRLRVPGSDAERHLVVMRTAGGSA